jgi:hypothetical protein
VRGKLAKELRKLAARFSADFEVDYAPYQQQAGVRHHKRAGGWGQPIPPLSSGKSEVKRHYGKGPDYKRYKIRRTTDNEVWLTVGKEARLHPECWRAHYQALKRARKTMIPGSSSWNRATAIAKQLAAANKLRLDATGK